MVIPPGYGYSLTEAISAIAAAKKLWDTFFHPYDNAANRIRELRTTFEVAKGRLLSLENQPSQHDQPYVGLDSLKRTIDECEHYLKNHAALMTESAESAADGKSKAKQITQTVKFAFDDRAKRLRSALALEMQQLALFYAELALTRTNDISNMMSAGTSKANEALHGSSDILPEPQSAKPARIGSGSSEDDFAVKDAFLQLQAVSYQYKRESKMKKGTPNVDAFAERVKNIFHQFCEDCGLYITDIPELDAKTALVAPSFTSKKAKLELTTPSLKNTLNPLTSTNRLQEEIDMNNDDDGFSAIVDFNKYYFGTPKLRDYDLQMVDGGRLVIWHSKDHNLLSEKKADSWRIPSSVERDLVIKHHLPLLDRKFKLHARCHPYVMKSDVAPNQRAQLEVQFHQGQKIEFYRAEPQDPEQPDAPTRWKKVLDETISDLLYVFEHPTYLDRFLSDLRGKKVQRFDFEVLWSERKAKGESTQQVLYLWRHRTDRSQNTISFYANKEGSQYREAPPTYEYRVNWFDAPVILPKPKNTIQLRLKRPRSESVGELEASIPSPKRRSSSFLKVVNNIFHSEHSSPEIGKPLSSSLPTPPTSGSLSGSSSQKSPMTSIIEKSPEEEAQREIAVKFGWLAVQFPSSDVMDKFITAFEGARNFTLGPAALSL